MIIDLNFFRNGGESGKVNKPRQLVDILPVSFLPVGEDPIQLRVLRVTGHSISYLQQQLRKFGIDEAKGNVGIAPYGWDWTGGRLVKNAKEQAIICEMIRLREGGEGFKAIASELNGRNTPAKNGGKWWHITVQKTVLRTLNGETEAQSFTNRCKR